MEVKKTNIWNVDQEFECLCAHRVWDALFSETAINQMPISLVEEMGLARQAASEIMANMISDTNFSLSEKLKELLNNFWDSLKQALNTKDYKKAKSIEKCINAYIVHGSDLGYDMLKNEINSEIIAKTEWIEINDICNEIINEMQPNFKNKLCQALLIAIETANYEINNINDLKQNIYQITDDLNLFYTNICSIPESVINDHGFVSIDVSENKILVTYQNTQGVTSVYDITNNLVHALSLIIKNENLD